MCELQSGWLLTQLPLGDHGSKRDMIAQVGHIRFDQHGLGERGMLMVYSTP